MNRFWQTLRAASLFPPSYFVFYVEMDSLASILPTFILQLLGHINKGQPLAGLGEAEQRLTQRGTAGLAGHIAEI